MHKPEYGPWFGGDTQNKRRKGLKEALTFFGVSFLRGT
jgi:hypothetical protein